MAGPFLPGGRDSMPGVTTRVDQTQNQFLRNADHTITRGMVVEKNTQDVGNTPVTKLRPGLVLVRVETGANKGKFVHVGHADDPGSGSRKFAGILVNELNMLSRTMDGTLEDKSGRGVIHGWVDDAKIIYGTANQPDIDELQGVLPLVQFEANA